MSINELLPAPYRTLLNLLKPGINPTFLRLAASHRNESTLATFSEFAAVLRAAPRDPMPAPALVREEVRQKHGVGKNLRHIEQR